MKTKKNHKAASKKRVTWTFEPDEVLQKLMADYLSLHPEKSRTEVMNEALRRKFPAEFLADAERQAVEAARLVSDLKRMTSSNEK